MVNQEEKRRIALQNLSKVKQKTGRKKKAGKKRTYRFALNVDVTIREYAKKRNIPVYMLINMILRDYLVKEKVLEKYFQKFDPSF